MVRALVVVTALLAACEATATAYQQPPHDAHRMLRRSGTCMPRRTVNRGNSTSADTDAGQAAVLPGSQPAPSSSAVANAGSAGKTAGTSSNGSKSQAGSTAAAPAQVSSAGDQSSYVTSYDDVTSYVTVSAAETTSTAVVVKQNATPSSSSVATPSGMRTSLVRPASSSPSSGTVSASSAAGSSAGASTSSAAAASSSASGKSSATSSAASSAASSSAHGSSSATSTSALTSGSNTATSAGSGSSSVLSSTHSNPAATGSSSTHVLSSAQSSGATTKSSSSAASSAVSGTTKASSSVSSGTSATLTKTSSSASTVAQSTAHTSTTANSTTHSSSTTTSASKLSSTVSSSSTSVKPSTTPSNGCPAGSTYQTWTDDFSTFDQSKWSLELGPANASTFGKNGLTMQLNQDVQNIVYQSTKQWMAPTTMSVGIKSAQAPGIISAMTFLKQAGVSDEIDLELIGGSWQVPIWKDGKRLEFGRDVTGTLASTSHNLTSWVYDDTNVVPYDNMHQWSVDWKVDGLTWSADGKQLLDIEKLPTGSFVNEQLPVRFGPWASGSGWAGQLDFTKNPHPMMQLTTMTVKGCMVN